MALRTIVIDLFSILLLILIVPHRTHELELCPSTKIILVSLSPHLQTKIIHERFVRFLSPLLFKENLDNKIEIIIFYLEAFYSTRKQIEG